MELAKPNVIIKYYSSNIGVFIQEEWNKFSNIFINDIPFSEGIKRKGYTQFNISSINKVQMKLSPITVLIGFELKDKSFESDKIPAYLSLEETEQTWDDTQEEMIWNEKYNNIRSLYSQVIEKREAQLVDINYDLVHLGELYIENVESPELMTIKLTSGHYGGTTQTVNLDDIAEYSDLEQMLTPEFMLHSRPCKLSSATMYKIVRAWVKENINPKAATISSDYEFCFSVNRKVKTKPVVRKTEIKKANGRSYATPRFNTSTATFKEVQIFEMTYAGAGNGNSGYNKYTIIPELRADNIQDLVDRLKFYLEKLMEEINKEVEECSCCEGYGYIVKPISSNFEKEWSE